MAQPKDWEMTYPSCNEGTGKLTGPLSLKNTLFEPTDIMGDDIKSSNLEKRIQCGRNKSIVMADSPNTDCDSAWVKGTRELAVDKLKNVTSFPTGQKKMLTSDKVGRIEELLIALKDKAKGVALKAHSKQEDETQASLKKENDQTAESFDTVRVRPGHLVSGKTMVSDLKEKIKTLSQEMRELRNTMSPFEPQTSYSANTKGDPLLLDTRGNTLRGEITTRNKSHTLVKRKSFCQKSKQKTMELL